MGSGGRRRAAPLYAARQTAWNERMSDEHESEHEEHSNRGPLIALVVVAVLILGGLWLSHVLGGAASTQDCIASGRTNCAPVQGPTN